MTNKPENAKVFVTGPDGLLGSNLLRELIARGYEITAMTETDKVAPTISSLPAKFVQGNLLEPAKLKEIIAGADVVIHCAANTSVYPPRAEIINKVNIDGTKNIIDACLANKVKKLIAVGTANSFAPGPIDQPGTEKNPYTGDQFGLDYMDSKKRASDLILEAVRDHGLNAVIGNPTFMIGPYDSRPSSGALILGVYNGKVPGYTNGGKNYVYVKDVAVAIANAITMGKSGESYILGHENLNYGDAFRKIASILGVKPPRIRMPKFVVVGVGALNSFGAKIFKYRPAITYQIARLSVGDHYYSSAKAVRELNMPQTNIDIAFQDAIAWFRENGYLTKK
ncbi:MAG: NAD-dependent epimerase/dehydratase family protein [Crocinitomicaceae bacterium]|nr:NAD-dependent epimerase/dehydratase family protein [Crocinitomicaceae bacterium]MBK8925409.1 NAD-dependent epimerase/dehydratase family protein [Crocinitomicaceae bacterium]